jgi:hypothetical protein
VYVPNRLERGSQLGVASDLGFVECDETREQCSAMFWAPPERHQEIDRCDRLRGPAALDTEMFSG